MKHTIFVLLLVLTAVAGLAEDKLVSYDQASSIITVDMGGQLKTGVTNGVNA